MPTVIVANPREVQSVVIGKGVARTAAEARRVARKFTRKPLRPVETTTSSHRFRLKSPARFVAGKYRTFQPREGVSLVYGTPRRNRRRSAMRRRDRRGRFLKRGHRRRRRHASSLNPRPRRRHVRRRHVRHRRRYASNPRRRHVRRRHVRHRRHYARRNPRELRVMGVSLPSLGTLGFAVGGGLGAPLLVRYGFRALQRPEPTGGAYYLATSGAAIGAGIVTKMVAGSRAAGAVVLGGLTYALVSWLASTRFLGDVDEFMFAPSSEQTMWGEEDGNGDLGGYVSPERGVAGYIGPGIGQGYDIDATRSFAMDFGM